MYYLWTIYHHMELQLPGFQFVTESFSSLLLIGYTFWLPYVCFRQGLCAFSSAWEKPTVSGVERDWPKSHQITRLWKMLQTEFGIKTTRSNCRLFQGGTEDKNNVRYWFITHLFSSCYVHELRRFWGPRMPRAQPVQGAGCSLAPSTPSLLAPGSDSSPTQSSMGTFQSTGGMAHKETPWAISGPIFAEDGSCSWKDHF